MSTFDPIAVHKAVAEFTPRRPQKFQDLFPAKEVIMELREKRASYRAIAELLTQHCLPASKTHLAMFCHQVLGETVRAYHRPPHRRRVPSSEPNTDRAPSPPSQEANLPRPLPPANPSDAAAVPQGRVRGPRIAQVRMLKPQAP